MDALDESFKYTKTTRGEEISVLTIIPTLIFFFHVILNCGNKIGTFEDCVGRII